MFRNSFTKDDPHPRIIPPAVKSDLCTWLRIIRTSATGLPIHPPPSGPPVTALIFHSDAAGGHFPLTMVQRPDFAPLGGASIGAADLSSVWFQTRLTWPPSILTSQTDALGHHFGNKSTTLEAIAMLLPLLAIPSIVQGKPILFVVDNLPLCFAFKKKYAVKDFEATLILRCVFFVASFLQCQLFIKHVPRCSTPLTKAADLLSRSALATPWPGPQIFHLTPQHYPHLFSWLTHPVLNWNLPSELLSDLRAFSPLISGK